MNLIFGTSLLLVCIVAELVFLTFVEEKKVPWKEIIVNVNSGHIMLWLARAFALLSFQLISTNYTLGWIGEMPVVAQWIFVVFAWDFCYYWSHRMHHEIPFLWHVHVVHHQGEHFNLSLGIRNSWYQPITSLPFFIGLAFVGVTLQQFVMVSAVHYFIQFYNHNAFIGKSGFLEKIFVTPSHHRVHHGTNPEYIDRNHGGTFVFWDKLFGSFQVERDDIEIRYGTTDRINPENPFWANMLPIFNALGWKVIPQYMKKQPSIHIKDSYLIIGSLMLFLLMLIYINNERVWEFTPLAYLFTIVFLGTIALGSIANGQRIGLVAWVVLAIPCTIVYLFYFEMFETVPMMILLAVITHGFFGCRALFANRVSSLGNARL